MDTGPAISIMCLSMMRTTPIHEVLPDYPDYLRDESRRTGHADWIAFPSSEEEARDVLAFAESRSVPVTVQGGRTGITAGAVPEGGVILNLSRMTRILGLRRDPATGNFVVRVQPGLVLDDLRKALHERRFDTEGWSEGSIAAEIRRGYRLRDRVIRPALVAVAAETDDAPGPLN